MLDDVERMTELDPEHMIRTVQEYPAQLHKAATMTLPSLAQIDRARIRNVCFAGMGGSGAGGAYAQKVLDTTGTISRVVHDYELPSWVDQHTLVIVTSYSGGTEETLGCVQQTIDRGAQWISLSSGGALKKAAERHEAPHLAVPGGLPPRGAFGYLTVPILRILAELDLIDSKALQDTLDHVEARAKQISAENDLSVSRSDNPAKLLAEALHTRSVLLVAETDFEAVAERIRCQLNENSKVLAFSRILPEANHNDTVAWSADGAVQHWSAVFIGDFARNPALAQRALFVRGLLEDRGVPVVDLDVPDEDPLAHALLTTYFGDWVSLYLAFLNGEDPSDVSVIPQLKDRCAKTGYVGEVKKALGI